MLNQTTNTNELRDEKYPHEIIELPSGGVFYSKDNPLSSGLIKLKLPTAKHEDILTSKNLITKGIVVDELLKSLILDKIDYDDLLLGDKNGLIISTRILLYGPDYNTQIHCPSCNILNSIKVNLSSLTVKEFPHVDDNLKGINEHDFVLPFSKTPIKFKFLTHKDEQEINLYLKKMKKHIGGIDPEITTRLGFAIIEINGEIDKAKIQHYVSEQMATRDTKAFREHLNSISPGIDTEIPFECDECGYEDILTMPMNVDFFWPSGKLQK